MTTAAAVRERPILFGGRLVRAILEGRKTVTRRVVRPQPHADGCPNARMVDLGGATFGLLDGCLSGEWPCPFGAPGDRLWVRETTYIDWMPYDRGPLPKTKPEDLPDWCIYYRADGECCQQIPECECGEVGPTPWRPSIHMPRWASRIQLEVTEVHVERLQEITTHDAWAEGVQIPTSPEGDVCWRLAPSNAAGKVPASYLSAGRLHPGELPATEGEIARSHFADLWDGINHARGYGWDANPWVWVIRFKRVEADHG